MTATKKNDAQVEVLYQKIGSKWYAFSIVGDEIFTGNLSEDEMTKASEFGLEKFIESPEASFDGEAKIS